jgi:hypothetical protein
MSLAIVIIVSAAGIMAAIVGAAETIAKAVRERSGDFTSFYTGGIGSLLSAQLGQLPVTTVTPEMVERLRERIMHHCYTGDGTFDLTDLSHALEQTLDPSLIGKF